MTDPRIETIARELCAQELALMGPRASTLTPDDTVEVPLKAKPSVRPPRGRSTKPRPPATTRQIRWTLYISRAAKLLAAIDPAPPEPKTPFQIAKAAARTAWSAIIDPEVQARRGAPIPLDIIDKAWTEACRAFLRSFATAEPTAKAINALDGRAQCDGDIIPGINAMFAAMADEAG